jgi:hypothetical protein
LRGRQASAAALPCVHKACRVMLFPGVGEEVDQGLSRHIHYVLIKLNNILDISFDFGKNAIR